VNCAKTPEPIEMPYGVWIWVGPKKHALDGSAHWCHLANTNERSVCGGHTDLWPLVMAAMRRRCGHYIFVLWFLLYLIFFISSPNLSRRRLDVYHTSTRGVALVRI